MLRNDAVSTAWRERWNHNNHYHAMLLRCVGKGHQRMLDIGCGHGFFSARLAGVAKWVDAMDTAPDVIAEAQRLYPAAGINFRQQDFLTACLPADHYDAVTAIASLHHMEFAPALRKIARVLRPGGVLAALGLYRETSLDDRLVSLCAVLPDRCRRLFDRLPGDGIELTAPICPPVLSLAEVRRTVSSLLPGAVVKRHLYWRYSLVWRKPLTIHDYC